MNDSWVQSPLPDELAVNDDLAAVDVDNEADTAMLTSDPTVIDKTGLRTCGLELKDPEQNYMRVAESMWPFWSMSLTFSTSVCVA